MSLSIMTPKGLVEVPVRGGVNLDLINRIENLEAQIEQIKQSRSTEQSFGLSKISDAQDVTESSSGLVLSSKQNNAGIEGTLANKIERINEKIDSRIFKNIQDAILVPTVSTDGVYVVKNNNIVFLKVSIQFKDRLEPGVPFFNIPEGYRPAFGLKISAASYVSGSTAARVLNVFANGNISIDFGAGANEWLFIYASYCVNEQ